MRSSEATGLKGGEGAALSTLSNHLREVARLAALAAHAPGARIFIDDAPVGRRLIDAAYGVPEGADVVSMAVCALDGAEGAVVFLSDDASCLGAPICGSDGARLGAFWVEDRDADRDWSAADASAVEAFAAHAAQILTEHRRRAAEQAARDGRFDALSLAAAGAAHDLNNLLTLIRYAVSGLGSAPEAAANTALRAGAMSALDRGAAIARRLLAYARRSSGAPEERAVSALLEEFESIVALAVREDLQIQFANGAGDATVICDQAELASALLNLVLNARDAIIDADCGDRIIISARLSDAMPDAAAGDLSRPFVAFAVQDNGPGMDKEIQRRALEPYFTTKPSGSGLGLAVASAFAQRAGGSLGLVSERGRGATATLRLPIIHSDATAAAAQDAADLEAAALEAADLDAAEPETAKLETAELDAAAGQATSTVPPAARGAPARGAGQVVLVVEDDPELQRATAEMLETLGYQVRRAGTSAEALVIIDRGDPIDALLADLDLPGGVDGAALAELTRARAPGAAILFMTGYSVADAEFGVDPAMAIQKPFTRVDLARAVQTALRSREKR